ncbi:MAG TPA: hypothetical protein VK845_11270 [Gemmatimonadales bacterium]|nr:hypothetical protein [Gemmatimonadales bacterium]
MLRRPKVRGVDGEFYFMALGGLGVSLAGFAGLIAALDRAPGQRTPVAKWRIRNIVIIGFSVTVIGFSTVALYTATRSNLELTVRLASVGFVLGGLWWLWFESRPGPAWATERSRRTGQAFTVALMVTALGNVVYGGLGLLQFLLLWQLVNAASIFVNTVRDLGREGSSEPAS